MKIGFLTDHKGKPSIMRQVFAVTAYAGILVSVCDKFILNGSGILGIEMIGIAVTIKIGQKIYEVKRETSE